MVHRGEGRRRRRADIYSNPGVVCGRWTGDKRRSWESGGSQGGVGGEAGGRNWTSPAAEVPPPGQRQTERCEELPPVGEINQSSV